MKVSKVRVDGQMFILQPEADVDALQTQIVDAVRGGGGFVTFDTVGRLAISVLISPGIPVRFEVMEQPEEVVAEWEENPPSLEASAGELDLATSWEWD